MNITSNNSATNNNVLPEIKARPFYHTNLENTLETNVFTQNTNNGKSIFEKVFSE